MLNVLFVFLISLSIPAFGQVSPSVSAHMIKLHEHLSGLIPMMFSTQDYADSRNEDVIFEHLGGFELTTLQMEHSRAFSKNMGTSVMFDVLLRSIGDASRAFQDGNKNYSRMMLGAAVSTCVACHTSGNNTRSFDFLSDEKTFEHVTSESARLELYLTTRQFEKAKKLAEDVLENFPGNNAKEPTLSYAAQNLAIYYARIQPSTKKATAYFEKMSQKESLPLFVREDLSDFKIGFQKARETRFSKQESVAVSLKKIQQKIGYNAKKPLLEFDGVNSVALMQAVGDVHHLLASNRIRSEKHLAEALHYLGLTNNSLNQNFVNQVDDAYFVVCIEIIPHSDSAIRCYRSLEESIMTKSTGSGGTFLDLEDLRMLARYKRLAYPMFQQIKN